MHLVSFFSRAVFSNNNLGFSLLLCEMFELLQYNTKQWIWYKLTHSQYETLQSYDYILWGLDRKEVKHILPWFFIAKAFEYIAPRIHFFLKLSVFLACSHFRYNSVLFKKLHVNISVQTLEMFGNDDYF